MMNKEEKQENKEKIIKKYKEMYEKFIDENICIINYKYSHKHKKTLSKYISPEEIRKDFILKNTLFGKIKKK